MWNIHLPWILFLHLRIGERSDKKTQSIKLQKMVLRFHDRSSRSLRSAPRLSSRYSEEKNASSTFVAAKKLNIKNTKLSGVNQFNSAQRRTDKRILQRTLLEYDQSTHGNSHFVDS